ncbi:hypothetical protein [Nocardioides sp.]|uniref:hypothetical protein n=1 Tax=Nocardioides sp. TaxID=35761 RepID=UPI002F42123F
MRFALGRGCPVVLEGIFHSPTYGAMLTGLADDHGGVTLGFVRDLTFEEPLRRHESREDGVDHGEAEMRRWWLGSALVDGLDERLC